MALNFEEFNFLNKKLETKNYRVTLQIQKVETML